jgi:ribosomal protein L25 (general stress protein Ctc)
MLLYLGLVFCLLELFAIPRPKATGFWQLTPASSRRLRKKKGLIVRALFSLAQRPLASKAKGLEFFNLREKKERNKETRKRESSETAEKKIILLGWS